MVTNFRMLSILCLSTFAAMIGMGILIPILPLYAKDLGASGTMLGMIFSSSAVTFTIFNPVVGRASDRFGFKAIIVAGLGIRIFAALSYVYASHPIHLVCIRLVEGLLTAMVFTAAGAYVAVIAPKGKEGSYMGIFNSSFLLGFGVGPLLGGIFSDLYGIDMPFYVMAGLLAVSTVLAFVFLPGKGGALEDAQKNEILVIKDSVKNLLASRLMKGLLIIAFILSFAQGALMVFLPVIAEGKNLSSGQIGVLCSSLMLIAGALQTPLGYLANRHNKVFLIITGILLVSIIVSVVPLCSSFWSFFILSIVGALGTAMGNPAALALLVRGAKESGFSLGFSIGTFNLATGIGMIVGPVASGFIMDLFSLNQLFYAISAVCLLAAFVIYRYTRDLKEA